LTLKPERKSIMPSRVCNFILAAALLNLAPIPPAQAASVPYRLKDCTDPISLILAKSAAEQVAYGIKRIPGALSVAAADCPPFWSTDRLGEASIALFIPDTCGVRITFADGESATQFAAYAKLFSGRLGGGEFNKKQYQAYADVCGAVKGEN
jgi:hypothetical protein